MIKVIVGNIGSGKTLTAVRNIIKRDRMCFVNFPINFKKAVRLEVNHIIKTTSTAVGKREIKKHSVNWAFWQEMIKTKGDFDIYIDEAHNVLNSRRAMSGWNQNFTSWITQVRKLFGSNEQNHLYLITQRITALDVVVRDLCHVIIHCSKQKDSCDNTIIFNRIFKGNYCLEKFIAYLDDGRSCDYMSYFFGDAMFKYYDSYSLVTFGEDSYL